MPEMLQVRPWSRSSPVPRRLPELSTTVLSLRAELSSGSGAGRSSGAGMTGGVWIAGVESSRASGLLKQHMRFFTTCREVEGRRVRGEEFLPFSRAGSRGGCLGGPGPKRLVTSSNGKLTLVGALATFLKKRAMARRQLATGRARLGEAIEFMASGW